MQHPSWSLYVSGSVSFVTPYWHMISANQSQVAERRRALATFYDKLTEERRVTSVFVQHLGKCCRYWDHLASVPLSSL